MFRCESILLKSYWVLVLMDVFTRRVIGFGVERADIDGLSVCRMFNKAKSGIRLPRYLSSDHDPLFTFHRWQANLRVLNIEEIKSIPYLPVSHPSIERLISTIRREYLDHVFFWNQFDLQRKLDHFKTYYNEHRVHTSLNGKTPYEQGGRSPPKPADLRHFAWRSDCNGLYQTPIAALD